MAALALTFTKRVLSYIWILGVTTTRSLEIAIEFLHQIPSNGNSTFRIFDDLIAKLKGDLEEEPSLIDRPRWPKLKEKILPLC